MYHAKAASFIRKVLRIRKRLIKDEKSKLNRAYAENRIAHIERYLDYYGFKTDLKMASFFHHHRLIIMDLIPGGNSTLTPSMADEFNELDIQAIDILARSKAYA